MKKIYLAALIIGTTVLSASAQVGITNRTYELGNQTLKNPASQTKVSNQPKATIWTEDFAGGFTTANGTWTTSGANANIWKHTYTTTTGQYSAGTPAFTPTSAANGFMIFDADSANTPGGAANLTGSLISPAIDLTAEATVKVGLQQDFRWCCTSTHLITVAVSSDNGMSWSPEFSLVGDVQTNDGYSDVTGGYDQSANITAYAAGNTVNLRFTWDGVGAGNSHYYWVIDDIYLSDVPANEVELKQSWQGDIVNDWEYSMMPLTQAREMVAGVVIFNNGSTDESPEITCVVKDANGVVATPAPITTLIPIGVTDTIWFNTGFTPTANGVYFAEFSIPADFDPSNNMSTTNTMTINDNLLAHDYGTTTTFGWSHTNTNPAVVDRANAVHGWGEIYSPTVNQAVYGMDVWIGTGTTIGNYLLAQVYQIDPDGDGSWIQGDLSGALAQVELTVAAANVNALTKISFPSAIQLEAGKNYIFELQKADGTTNSSFFIAGTDGNQEDDDGSAVGYGEYGATNPNGPTYWSGWDGGFYIRPNFENTAGLVETAIEGISIYPNPTEGKLTVTNKNNYNNTIEVVDVAGKVVYKGTSNKTVELNIEGNGAGVYFVNITNELGSITEKVTLK